MPYLIEKCTFTAPLHVGHERTSNSLESAEMILRSDTLFSAMTHEAVRQGCMAEWIEAVSSGRIAFSDMLPYHGDTYYLPKPACFVPAKERPVQDENSSVKKKQMKKLQVLPPEALEKFMRGEEIQVDQVPDFGRGELQQRLHRARDPKDDPKPYYVGRYFFHQGCGLYTIVRAEGQADAELFRHLFKDLGVTGVGGKVSSGLGKYETMEMPVPKPLEKMLADEGAPSQVLLSTALPQEDELPSAMEGAATVVLRRAGFVQSSTYISPLMKRRTLYMFRSGSTFRRRFRGALMKVGDGEGAHPVYRCALGLFAGVRTS